MLSDAVLTQIVIGAVTLISLWIHRVHGSRENRDIATSLNGHRTVLLQKIESLEKRLGAATGENIKLTAEAETRSKNEVPKP